MPTKSELTGLETVINRLIRYVKRSDNDKYKDNSALITALMPSEEKLSMAEGTTVDRLVHDYLEKHLSTTEIKKETLLQDYMDSLGTLEPLPLDVMGVVADYLPPKT